MAMGRTAADVNIIVGGPLLFWGVTGAMYMTQFHVPPQGCGTSAVIIAGSCYSTAVAFLVPILAGLIMMVLGAVNREPVAAAEDLLRTDPFTWTVLAVFLSVFLGLGAYAFYLSFDLLINNVDPGRWVVQGGSVPLLATVTLLSAVAGIVFFVGFFINAGHVRRRRRFHAGFQRAVARHQGRET